MAQKEKVFGVEFWLMCLSSALFFASFNTFIPELPSFLTSIGGEDYKGFIIPLFTLAALISRPFSGKLSDTIGRVPVMIFGAFVCVVISFLYPFALTVPYFLLLRFLHGMSTGFNPTGSAALLADLVPAKRRGEAMGLMGVATSTGMAIGPALGGYIGKTGATWMVFVTGGLMAFASILVIRNIKETLPNPKPFSFKLLKIKKEDLFEPRVWLPSLVMLLAVVPFGVILTVIPDFSDHLGLENRGSFFSYYVASSLLIRIFIGKFSDRFGREFFAMLGTGALGLALVLIANATDYTSLMTAAVVFGIGSGINSPTIFAWTTDLSRPEKRGRGLSTMYMALELGIGFGGYFGATLHANIAENFQRAFTIPAYFSFTATTIVAASMIYKMIKK